MDWIARKMTTSSGRARRYFWRKHFKMFFRRQPSELNALSQMIAVNLNITLFIYIFSAFEQLQRLGIFKNLKAFIDTDKSPKASPYGYVVSFEGEELSRVTGTIGTEIGQNDGSLTSELVSPNIFGRGEKLSINYSYSYIKATELNVKLLKPFYHTAYGDHDPE